MLVGYGYASDEEEDQNADGSVVLGELHAGSKRKASQLTTSLVPKILKEAYSDVDSVPSYQSKRAKTSGSLFDILPKPKTSKVAEDGEVEAQSTEKPEDQEAEKVEMYSSVSSGLSLAELGLLPAKKETHTVPATTKQAETQQTTTPQPQKEEKPPVIGDDVSSEPVVGPYVPADFDPNTTYPGYEEVEGYPVTGAYPSYDDYSQGHSQQPPMQYVPYAPAPPPVSHIMGNQNKWNNYHGELPADIDIIDVSATALHNQTLTRSELAQKRRLEILARQGSSRAGSRKGQLSSLIVEAERTAALEEENKAYQRAMKAETKKRYCW